MSTHGGGVSPPWSAQLRGRRIRDTEPEKTLRSAVHALGLRFRLHRKVAPRCTADFVLPRHSVAVFVDGCFWHGCPSHGRRQFRGPNSSRWEAKITANMERDARNTQAATDAGWTVARIWECGVRADVGRAAQRVADAVHHCVPVLPGGPSQPVVTAASKVASAPSSSCGRVGQ
ncbi:very short patch repair endonuclease [Streptomyces sp. NPDC046751]|uniref:very short patch repair endonuclease n=1 Tax=Streptomyces sp. NPDC046751 TaxID=3160977 RepID=UPI0033F605DA